MDLEDHIDLVNRITTLEQTHREFKGAMQNLELAFSRLTERLTALEVSPCDDCGVEVPKGSGLGYSEPEEVWTDRTKSRGIIIKPLCRECMAKRITKEDGA